MNTSTETSGNYKRKQKSLWLRGLGQALLAGAILLGSTAQAAILSFSGGMAYSGTAPFTGVGAGNDASATDSVIRTFDAAGFTVGYSLAPSDTSGVIKLQMGATTLPGSYVGPTLATGANGPIIAAFKSVDLPTGSGGCQNIQAAALSAAQVSAFPATVSGVSADGQTLVCVMASPTGGATNTFLYRVQGTAPNGATIAPPTVSFQSAGNALSTSMSTSNDGTTTYGLPTLTVSAAPRWNLEKGGTIYGATYYTDSGPAGESGYVFPYRFGIYAVGSRKGLEAINGNVTINDSFVDPDFPNSRIMNWDFVRSSGNPVAKLSPANLNGCTGYANQLVPFDNLYYYVNDRDKLNVNNSTLVYLVANGGACNLTAFDNTAKTASFTISGTDFSLNFYPTKAGTNPAATTLVNAANLDSGTNQWWVADKTILLWAPLTDMGIPSTWPKNKVLTNTAQMQATSVTGQANVEPITSDNARSLTATAASSGFIRKLMRPIATYLAGYVPPAGMQAPGCDSAVTNDCVVNQVAKGDLLVANAYGNNNGVLDLSAGRVCDKIDNARFTFWDATDTADFIPASTNYARNGATGLGFHSGSFSNYGVNQTFWLGVGGPNLTAGTWTSTSNVANEYTGPSTSTGTQALDNCGDASTQWFSSLAALKAAGFTEKDITLAKTEFDKLPVGASAHLIVPLRVNSNYAFSGNDLLTGPFVAGTSIPNNTVIPNQAVFITAPGEANAAGIAKSSDAVKILNTEFITILKTSPNYTVQNSPVSVGSVVTYNLVVNASSSNGTHVADIDVWDVLPQYLAYQSGSSTLGGAALADPVCANSGLPVALFPAGTQPLAAGYMACKWVLPAQTVLKTSVGAAAANLPKLSFNAVLSVAAPSGTTLLNTSFADSPDNVFADAKYGGGVTGFVCNAGENCKFSNWLLSTSSSPGILLNKVVDKTLVPINVGFTYTLNYAAIGNALANTKIMDVLPYTADGRTAASNYVGTLKLTAPIALPVASAGPPVSVADPLAEIRYTKNAPANINRNPANSSNDYTGTAINSSINTAWCTVLQFGTASCPAVIGDATAFVVIPRKTDAINPEMLLPGEVFSLVVPVIPAANAVTNVYSNDFIGDSTSLLARPAGSSQVSTRVVMPDVISTKTAAPVNVNAGASVVYTVTVKNNTGVDVGPIENLAGTVIKMTDSLPAYLSIASAADVSGTGWDCSASTAPSNVTCTYTGLLPLGVGANIGGTIEINALVIGTAPTVTGYVNTATANMTGQTELSNNNSSTALINITEQRYPVSGTVFNDVGGLVVDNFVNGIGTEAPVTGVATSLLTAYLVDKNNLVIATSDIAANGTYSFPTVPLETGYTVVLANQAPLAANGSIGIAPPTPSLPAGWTNTGEVNGSATTPADATNSGSGAAMKNGISAPFDVVNATVIDINFGIEQPPVGGTATFVSQPNPAGVTTYPVAAGAFVGTLPIIGTAVGNVVTGSTNATDPAPGAVTSITFTTFPADANTFTVGGTSYTSATWAALTTTQKTFTAAQLAANPIAVDPLDGDRTVTIPYMANDAVNLSSAGSVILPFAAVYNVSGAVYNDPNGNADSKIDPSTTINGAAAPFTTLTAYLVNAGGTIVSSADVNSSGGYTFTGVVPATAYYVVLSNVAGVTGLASGLNTTAANTLPAGWINTSEVTGVAGTATNVEAGAAIGDAKTATLDVVAADVVNVNFGIEQPPVAGTATYVIQGNPAGATSYPIAAGAFAGTLPTIGTTVGNLVTGSTNATDPAPGAVTAITFTTFPANTSTFTVGGTTYTSATWAVLTSAQKTFTTAQLAANPISVDPIDSASAITVTVPYLAVDAAGQVSLTAGSVVLPFGPTFAVSGAVFNDTNALVDTFVNGTGTEAPTTGVATSLLTAYLVDKNGKVVATSDVAAAGTYSFPAVMADTGYTIVLANQAPLAGGASMGIVPPAASLPAGWVNTGEVNGSVTTAADATNSGTGAAMNDGITAAFAVTNANVVDRNFGIEQPPIAGGATFLSVPNPGTTANLTVAAGAFTGTLPATGLAAGSTNATDPAATGSGVTNIFFPSFPAAGATSITINGASYTAATFPVTGVTVPAAGLAVTIDPLDGSQTMVIPYYPLDAAGLKSTSAGSVTVVVGNPGKIDIVKAVGVPKQIGTTGKIFEIPYAIVVGNVGATSPTVYNVQADDNLKAAYPTAATITVSSYAVNPGSGTPAANCSVATPTTFLGTSGASKMLSGTNDLSGGQSCIITYLATVDYGAAALPATALSNTAYASGMGADTTANLGYVITDAGVATAPAGNTTTDISVTAAVPTTGLPGTLPTLPPLPATSGGDAVLGVATPVVLTAQKIDAVKAVGIPKQTGLYTFDIPYSVIVGNVGATSPTLYNVQADDNLKVAYPTASTITVSAFTVAPVGTTPAASCTAASPAFLGTSAASKMLRGTGDLAGGQSCSITFVATVTFAAGTVQPATAKNNSIYASAVATDSVLNPGYSIPDAGVATAPAVATTTDISVDDVLARPAAGSAPGTAPAIPALPGTRGSDSATGVVTPVLLMPQAIDIVKAAGVPKQISPTKYEIDYNIVVGNVGSVATTPTVYNVQANDNLRSTFPATATYVVSGYTVASGGGTPAATCTVASPAFDGTLANSKLLAGTDDLLGGQSCEIKFKVTVDYGATPPPATAQNNSAYASGTGSNAVANPVGITVTDAGVATPPAVATAIDNSVTAPATTGIAGTPPTKPALPATANADAAAGVPTPVSITPQKLDVVKAAGVPLQTGPKTFVIDYSIVVGNVTATSPTVYNVQANDNLKAVFPTATTITVSNYAVTASAGTPAGSCAAPAPAYAGTATASALLAGTGDLAGGQSCVVTFKVTVDFGTNPVPAVTQNNSVYASGVGSDATTNPGYTITDAGAATAPAVATTTDISVTAAPTSGIAGTLPATPALPATPGADAAAGVPTPVTFVPQKLDTVKAAGVPMQLAPKIFEISYSIVVANVGATSPTVYNVQANDNLKTVFPTATTITVSNYAVTAGAGTPAGICLPASAPVFAGTAAASGLLSGTGDLAGGQSCVVTFKARVDYGASAIPSAAQGNLAYASGVGSDATTNPGYSVPDVGTPVPAAATTTDVSVDSVTARPPAGSPPGTPPTLATLVSSLPSTPGADAPAGVPTPVSFIAQKVDAVKAAGVPKQVGAKQFEVSYSVVVGNVGATSPSLYNVQADDNLKRTFPTAIGYVVSNYAVAAGAGTPSTACTAATPAFLGTAAASKMLKGDGDLAGGQSCVITFKVTVDYGANPVPTVSQNNMVYASAVGVNDVPNPGYTVPDTGVPVPPAAGTTTDISATAPPTSGPPGTLPATPSLPTIAGADIETGIATPVIFVIEEDGELLINKSTVSKVGSAGEIVEYVVTVRNTSSSPVKNGKVTDTPPVGFELVAGSAKVNGVAATSTKTGAELSFDVGNIAAKASIELRYQMKLGDDVVAGDATNCVAATGVNALTGNDKESGKSCATIIIETGLFLQKLVNLKKAEIGDSVEYSLQVKSVGGKTNNVKITDNMPLGFKLIAGTVRMIRAGVTTKMADPTGAPGPQTVYSVGTVANKEVVEIRYRVRLGVGSDLGDGINRAQAKAPYARSSLIATAKVEVTQGVFTREACVIGKVFVDCNQNKMQDACVDDATGKCTKGEPGIPGVRLYMEDGTNITTDENGQYSICGIRATSHVMKVDMSTMPVGSRMGITSNANVGQGSSILMNPKVGELYRADFIESSCYPKILEQLEQRHKNAAGAVTVPLKQVGQDKPGIVFDSQEQELLPPSLRSSVGGAK